MTGKRLAMFLPLAALTGAVLACNLPPPTSAGPAPTVAEPTEPTQAAPTASATPGETREPVPSPSPTVDTVSRVVYTSEGSLWVLEGEKPPRQLTVGPGDRAPKLSPDGQWLLFRRAVEPAPTDIPRYELRVIAVDGSGQRVLVGPEDLPGDTVRTGTDAELPLDRLPTQTAWLPDSRTVAFSSQMQVGYGTAPNYDLWLVDVESGAPEQLLDDGEGGTFAFSPDASRLVVCTPTTVTMLAADGSSRRALVTFEPVTTYSEYSYTPMPIWAPGGSHALVGISSPDPGEPDANATLWRLPLDGDATSLATLAGQVFFNTQSGELWSPDRTHIVYTQRVGESGDERNLIVAKADGSDPQVYATGELGFLNWASEGSDFTFYQNLRTEVYRGSASQPPVL